MIPKCNASKWSSHKKKSIDCLRQFKSTMQIRLFGIFLVSNSQIMHRKYDDEDSKGPFKSDVITGSMK